LKYSSEKRLTKKRGSKTIYSLRTTNFNVLPQMNQLSFKLTRLAFKTIIAGSMPRLRDFPKNLLALRQV